MGNPLDSFPSADNKNKNGFLMALFFRQIAFDLLIDLIDSFFQSAPVGAKPLWFIGKSLEFLSDADIAYFAKDWQKARGCKIEHERAVEYGIPRIDHV